MKETKRYRIRKNYEYKTVYRRGKSYSNKYLVLYVRKSNRKLNRIGISVSKKVGNAVTRNRVKRLIRENYIRVKDDVKIGYEFVVVARSLSANANYHVIGDSVIKILKKAGVYKGE